MRFIALAAILLLNATGAAGASEPKAASAKESPPPVLDFTLPPKKFKEIQDAELKIYRQKIDARIPKPPKAIAILLDVRGARSLKAGKRVLAPGHVLHDGDEFETPDGVSVRVGFRTGDQLLIAPRTEVRFRDVADGGPMLNPILQITTGEVRVLVRSFELRKEKPPAGKLVFLAGTPEGYFAATGTDYVVYVKPDLVSAHTLTGTVSYARTFEPLLKGGGEEIKAGHYATINPPSRALRTPKPFDKGFYVKGLERRHPDFRRLWVDSDREAREGKVTQRFAKAEEALGKPPPPKAFVAPKRK